MMRLIFLGGPGAGKSLHSRLLCEKFQLQRISVGEVLRESIAQETELGKQAEPYLSQGQLLPDTPMIEFMRDRITRPEAQNGWILEGYPRTAFQAEELDFLLDDLDQSLDRAIYLEVSDETLVKRSKARALSDDTHEAIQSRIEIFHTVTKPILEYYSPRHKLLAINAEDSIEKVSEKLINELCVSC